MDLLEAVSLGVKRLKSVTTPFRAKQPEACDSADAAVALGMEHEGAGNLETASKFYRRALQIEPATTEAIAGLGRVQYRAPDQPFMDELKRRGIAPLTEVLIEVRNPCNYRCFYCVATGWNNEPVKKFDLDAIERTLNEIETETVDIQLECGGGEPTVHPQFAELARICARRGSLSFPTNNSQDPKRWLPTEYAPRISVRSALHPEAETPASLEKYIRNARYLIDAKAPFISAFISHPTRIHKIPEYRKLFADHEIPFTPIPFIGEYEGRSYPHAHTAEERAVMGIPETDDADDADYRDWYRYIQPHVNRIRNFRGISCHAGYRSLYVTRDGSVRRCVYDARKLPAPLKAPEPCGVKSCGCGMLLEKLNANFDWPRNCSPFYPPDWMTETAARFGYKSPGHAMVVEQTRMYDELMRSHGKDEFPEPL